MQKGKTKLTLVCWVPPVAEVPFLTCPIMDLLVLTCMIALQYCISTII